MYQKANILQPLHNMLNEVGFKAYELQSFPNIRIVCDASTDVLNEDITLALNAILSVDEGKKLLQDVNALPLLFGTIIIVTDSVPNSALLNLGIVFINLQMNELHYLGEDDQWYPLQNVAALIAHELEHLRSARWTDYPLIHLRQFYEHLMITLIASNAFGELLSTAEQNGDIDVIIEHYVEKCFQLYQTDELINIAYNAIENNSIDTENIFHRLAGEIPRAKKYAKEVCAENPSKPNPGDNFRFMLFSPLMLYAAMEEELNNIKHSFGIKW